MTQKDDEARPRLAGAAGRAAGFQVLQIRHPNDVPEVLRTAGILG